MLSAMAIFLATCARAKSSWRKLAFAIFGRRLSSGEGCFFCALTCVTVCYFCGDRYELKLKAHYTATFTRGSDSDPVHFKGSFRVENVCEDSPLKEWRIRETSCEVVDPPTDGVTPAIMVAEPGTARPGKRVMSGSCGTLETVHACLGSTIYCLQV